MSVRVLCNYLFALLILLLSHQTFPQTYIQDNKIQFRQLTHYEGFVARDIRCFYQDSKGFLWMCPSDRLIRFDGKKQKLFRNSEKDSTSLGANTVKCIFEDLSGVLWFGTGGGGLNKYNSAEENFTRYAHNPRDPNSISSNDVNAIYEDSSGILWVGTLGGGLNKFDKQSGKFVRYKNKPNDITSISNDNVTAIYEDSKGNLWIGTSGGGINIFDRVSQKFTRFVHNEFNLNSLSNNNITGICEDAYNNLWISTMGGGLNKLILNKENQNPVFRHYIYDPEDPYSLGSNTAYKIYLDREKEFWIGTWGGGLNKMITHPGENSSVTFISYKHNPLDIFSLNDDNVNSIYEDNSGMLWVSTSGAGLQVYDKHNKQFRLYANEPNNPNSLSSTSVWSVYEDREGTRWIGTGDGGLNKMIKGTDRFIHYKYDPNDLNSLSDNCVSAIYEDKFNNLWVGTWNGGLNKFDRKSGKFLRFRHDPENPSSISDNRICSITGDSSGNLWIATYYGGLNKFNMANGSFTYYKHNSLDSRSIGSDCTLILYYDMDGRLLIATKAGLDAFEQKNKKFIHFNFSGDNLPANKDMRVTSIHQDKSGILWIGTAHYGLVKYDLKEGIKKIYTTNNGFPINYITAILEDDHGNLWVSTTIGVSRFNPLTETIRTYIYEDGIQGIGEMIPFKSRTGEMIFGGVMGLSIFHPDSISDYSHLPPVYFTDFYLFNKRTPIGYDNLTKRTILNRSMVECKEIVLNYDDNVLSFDFAIIDFHSLFKWNQYAYKMEGFNREWVYSGDFSRAASNNRSVTYTNLDPGEYTLRVKAANSDNVWNEKGAALKIIILPPWWKTWWAYFLYVLLVLGIIYFTWRMQLRKIRTQNEIEMSRFEAQKLHEVDELKSRFFTNISHEFRTPLTLILGPVKQIIERMKDENTKNELRIVHNNANKLLVLVNQLLDISKLESGNMRLKTSPQNIIPLLRALALSFTSYAERKRITLKFLSSEEEIIAYLDKDKMEKIISNILSNAFKFTPEGGRIEVNIDRDDKYADIRVTDTGIGIPKEKLSKIFDRFYQVDGSRTREQEGTGIGLSLTKELIELHKGKIKVESEESKGTTFIISIPLGKEHLKPEEISDTVEEKLTFVPVETVDLGIEDKREPDFEWIMDSGKPLLLIVEDNSDVRNFIKNNLKKVYRTVEAVNGEDGWNKSLKQMPDLIISDVMMPKMDGIQLCEKLKTDERTSHIPVILLTAKAAKQDKIEGYETGADDYIMKPFEPDELRARISNLIEQRKRLHEHFHKDGIFEISKTKITPVDKGFLQKAFEIIDKNLTNASFGIDSFSEQLNISKSLLHKKLFSLTGEPPGEIIRRLRLKKAADLIEQRFGNLSQIALEVGFNNPAYFSECFKKQFGVSPSQFQQRITNS